MREDRSWVTSRCGRKLGRVAVYSTTLRKPDEAKIKSEKTVAAQGTLLHPIESNPSQRVIAIGSTCGCVNPQFQGYSGVSRTVMV